MSKNKIATNVDRHGVKKKGNYIRGGPCIFPYYYKKQLHYDCDEGTDGRGRWCPTSLKPEGQKIKDGIPVSPFGSIGHCPDTSSYSEERKIPLKKYSRKRITKTVKIASKPSKKLSRKPKSTTLRKGKQSKKSVKAPKNKIFSDLKKIISSVTKSEYYNTSYGWKTSLLKRHLYLAQTVRDEVNEDAKIICTKNLRDNVIFKLWSDNIKKSPPIYKPPPYSSSSRPLKSVSKKQSSPSKSSSRSLLKSKKLPPRYERPPSFTSPRTAEISDVSSVSSVSSEEEEEW